MRKLKPKVNIERHTLKIAELEVRVRELETDLKLNASMLAKQCDLAREAETRVYDLLSQHEIASQQIQIWEARVKELEGIGEERKRLGKVIHLSVEIINLKARVKELEGELDRVERKRESIEKLYHMALRDLVKQIHLAKPLPDKDKCK